MHETSWQIELRVRDSDLALFRTLMDRYRVGSPDAETPPHGFLWWSNGDGMHVTIAKRADMIAEPMVTWSADWPTARQAFAQIGAAFAADLLVVAEPVNLVTYGDGEPETGDDMVVDVASVARRPRRAHDRPKKRVVVHADARLQLANG